MGYSHAHASLKNLQIYPNGRFAYFFRWAHEAFAHEEALFVPSPLMRCDVYEIYDVSTI